MRQKSGDECSDAKVNASSWKWTEIEGLALMQNPQGMANVIRFVARVLSRCREGHEL